MRACICQKKVLPLQAQKCGHEYMIQLKDIQSLFFLGIGGIGMSALARYFASRGYAISGYDRTPSPLTKELESEGMHIIYDDDPSILCAFRPALLPQHTLVVRTPAVPEDNAIYTFLRSNGYDIRKRAEVLGLVTQQMKALCVAGTHGKTTTSTMLAHLLNDAKGINAFLGGISMNYGTNVLIAPQSEYVVVEADEYDRSFHHLRPYISVVTAVDADHLDIYGTPEAYREAFAHYTSLISGALVMKHGINLQPRLQEGVKCYTYGVVESGKWKEESGKRKEESGKWKEESGPDFYAANIRVGNGTIVFDFHTPDSVIADVRLGVPVWVNIENATAAMAAAYVLAEIEQQSLTASASGADSAKASALLHFKERMACFKGVQRRFNIHVNTPKVVYIDDYAHHPEEIATAIDSIRKLFPERRLIGVFQPHLYTRTRDFADGFARVLSTLDEAVLLPIYPAREKPIEGVNSKMLVAKMGKGLVVEKAELVDYLKGRVAESKEPVVVLTVGAGDIDRLVPDVAKALEI